MVDQVENLYNLVTMSFLNNLYGNLQYYEMILTQINNADLRRVSIVNAAEFCASIKSVIDEILEDWCNYEADLSDARVQKLVYLIPKCLFTDKFYNHNMRKMSQALQYVTEDWSDKQKMLIVEGINTYGTSIVDLSTFWETRNLPAIEYDKKETVDLMLQTYNDLTDYLSSVCTK
ncbi:orf106 [Sucra jujuba nucleopolyhedrovirus]|uniref:Orf106 n=1 Tax=Sucra jujuba nucleopolyhedrovirus TaxID=1563660 RepID=A0A097P935_9ABAC|nr:orf106 [Sucra jujuba nucleopolyhedrovirus]AIU41345.1 orf106 [Sucra jujuba nucleopolyhedrovirus]